MDLDLTGVTAASISAIQRDPDCAIDRPRGIREVARDERTGDPGARMKPTPESSAQEVLAGLVERVTFHNAENGFCVLRAKARGHRDLVTVVGHAAIISAGEWITTSGEWINDRAQGLQFKARFLKSSAPTSISGTEKYQGSAMIRGIGPAYAKNLSCNTRRCFFNSATRREASGKS
jgi:exodeoxyribonuclease V alpha subunit